MNQSSGHTLVCVVLFPDFILQLWRKTRSKLAHFNLSTIVQCAPLLSDKLTNLNTVEGRRVAMSLKHMILLDTFLEGATCQSEVEGPNWEIGYFSPTLILLSPQLWSNCHCGGNEIVIT